MKWPYNLSVGAVIGWTMIAVLVSGCQQTPWLTMAKKGSLPELKKAVDQGQQRSAFDRASTEHLAMAILEREIQSATDPDGESLVGQLSDCALALESPLSRRAERSDETAGTALFALVSAGHHLNSREWHVASKSVSGARRAAAALDSRAPERWAVQKALLNDADPRVRQAALRSSHTTPLRSSWDTQIAILRRDPDPLCRQLAARSIGILGGAEASTVLSDAWARADTPLRLAIVSGMAQRPTFTIDGQQRLVAIARGEPGPVGVLAAADLATGASHARSLGQARITRSLEFGSSEDRALAIAASRWDLPEQAEQLLRLGLQADPETRVRALKRWLEHPGHRWPAITWLRQLSEGDTGAAILAREVLANYGDQTVRLGLRAQLHYAKTESRTHAARHLWKLGDMNGVAQALADDAPEVRVATACSVLAKTAAQ
jgi:hypothetical protein